MAAAQLSRVRPRSRPVQLWWLARVALLPLPLLGAARPLLAVVVLRPAVELPARLVAALVVELPAGVGLALVVALLGLVKPAPALLGPLLVGLLPRLTVAPVNLGSAAQPAARILPVRVVPRPAVRIRLVVLLLGVLPRKDLLAVDLLGVLRPGRLRPAVAPDLVAVLRVAAVRVDLAWTPGLPAALSPRVPVTGAHLVAVQRPAVLHRAPATTLAATPGGLVDRVQPRHSS